MTSCWPTPRCSAPTVTADPSASCPVPASSRPPGGQPASPDGRDPIAAIGQNQSLIGAQTNHRRQLAEQLGIAAHPLRVQIPRPINKPAGQQKSDADSGHRSAMIQHRSATPWRGPPAQPGLDIQRHPSEEVR